MGQLDGKRVACLAMDGFEQSELFRPKKALEHEGAVVVVIAPHDGSIRGWKEKNWAEAMPVDLTLERASPIDFDALLLPGGTLSADKLRMDEKAVAFAKAFVDSGKPVAAICHGPWLLAEAGALRGRTLTSYPSLKTDLSNAGAHWVDQPVAVDRNWVTSRKPDDLDAFCAKAIEIFVQGPLAVEAAPEDNQEEEQHLSKGAPRSSRRGASSSAKKVSKRKPQKPKAKARGHRGGARGSAASRKAATHGRSSSRVRTSGRTRR